MSETTSESTFPNTAAQIWQPTLSSRKKYRHFDSELDVNAIMALVRDPKNIAIHPFRPLLHFEQSYRRPPKNGKKRGLKIRPIRYACRKDAYIYKYYREILSRCYEAKLREKGLQGCIIAYRRIPVAPGSNSNKSNIHFAKDAFDCIDELGKCCAIAVDISDFFGSLEDHRLKRIWTEILEVDKLPADHKAVFKSIVNYKYVNLNDALVALGYSRYDDKTKKYHYKVNPKKIPIQLCTPNEFRKKIVDAKLVKSREKSHGIPQGTPISDLLANMYLLDFDIYMNAYAHKRGGFYFRYSDDILLVLPGDGRTAFGAEKVLSRVIKKCGEKLEIKPSKTEIVCYTGKPEQSRRCYSLVPKTDNSQKKQVSVNEGLSYLGFRYDGLKVYMRNSTLSNLRRKVINASCSAAHLHVRGHREKDLTWLLAKIPINSVKTKFMNVEDFEDAVREALEKEGTAFKVMTFWSYIRRARKIFGNKSNKMFSQLRGIETLIKRTLEKEIITQFNKRT